MIKRNALSNLVGRLWGIVSLFAFVPFYISYLGSAGYGYIGFYNTLIAILAFADLGFSAATTREFARLSDGTVEHETEKARLLRSYEFLYLLISAIVALVIFLGANWIAHRWLISEPGTNVSHLIMLMGFSIALQLPTNLYVGALMGSEKQVLANGLQIGWGLIRSAGVLPVLHYISNDLQTFFIWQLLCNLIFLVVLYTLTWRKIKSTNKKFSTSILKKTYKYALGMAGMGVLASFATQIDKILVTKSFAIEIVGYYSLAATLALIPLILITTLAKAAFPRLTRFKEKNQFDDLKTLYLKLCKIANIAILPLAIVLACYSHSIILIWTHSVAIADSTSAIVSLLMLAQGIQALTVLPFHLSLSYAYVRINLFFSALMIIEIPCVYYLLMTNKGASDIALSVLITVVTVFIPYMYLLHSRLVPGVFRRWFTEIILTSTVCAIAIYIMTEVGIRDGHNLIISVINGIITWFVLTILIFLTLGLRRISHVKRLFKGLN